MSDVSNSIYFGSDDRYLLLSKEKNESARRELAVLGLYASNDVFELATKLLREFEMASGDKIDDLDLVTETTLRDLSDAARPLSGRKGKLRLWGG